MKPSRPYLVTTEILYLVIFAVSTFEVWARWSGDRQSAYLFMVFAVGSIFMFLFRRHVRRKLATRWKSNGDVTKSDD